MPPERIQDDGSLAYAMEYCAGRLADLKLNPTPGTTPQNAAQAFFSLARQETGELCVALHALVVRYYAEHPPSAELRDSWTK